MRSWPIIGLRETVRNESPVPGSSLRLCSQNAFLLSWLGGPAFEVAAFLSSLPQVQ